MRPHPDEALKELIGRSSNLRFLRNMQIVHEICREVSGGAEKNFSPAAIGRMSEARRGPSLNTFYSPKGAHFRKLINAWIEWEGKEPKRSNRELLSPAADNDLLEKIEDIVVRSYVGLILAERRRLRAEVNTLKALSRGEPVIDLRPKISETSVELLSPAAALLDDERETLERTTSDSWLKEQGMSEGPRGELLDRDGKIILMRGAIPGIRKLLGGRKTS